MLILKHIFISWNIKYKDILNLNKSVIKYTTRMHSSRMCTVCSSSHLLGWGCLPECMLVYTPPLGLALDTPLGLDLDPWTPRHLPARPLNLPPGCGPRHLPGRPLNLPPVCGPRHPRPDPQPLPGSGPRHLPTKYLNLPHGHGLGHPLWTDRHL